MQQNYIMRLGPLDKPEGAFYEYIVFPGRPENNTYYGADAEAAIANILFDYRPEELVCEELLAEVGRRSGLAARPLSLIAAHGLALFALDRFPGRPFQDITEETLVYHFCAVAKRHFELLSDERAYLYRPLRLKVSGTIEFVTDVYLHPLQNEGDFISIMMEKALIDPTRESVEADALKPYDRISAARYATPAFIANALHRAHHLDFIPIPARRAKGETGRVADLQLAILVSTLNAISYLQESHDTGKSQFSIGKFQVNCDVCLAAG
jgi:hypothetical protein